MWLLCFNSRRSSLFMQLYLANGKWELTRHFDFCSTISMPSRVKISKITSQTSNNRVTVQASVLAEDRSKIAKLTEAQFWDELHYDPDDFNQQSYWDEDDSPKEEFCNYMSDISLEMCTMLNTSRTVRFISPSHHNLLFPPAILSLLLHDAIHVPRHCFPWLLALAFDSPSWLFPIVFRSLHVRFPLSDSYFDPLPFSYLTPSPLAHDSDTRSSV